MSQFYVSAPRRLVSAFLIALCACTQALAQGTTPPIYSNSGISGATPIQECNTILNVTTCFGSITHPEYATDADFTTAATLNVPASVLLTRTLKLRMDMDGLVPAGHRAGIVVARDGGVLNLLGVNVASAIKIRTYLSSNGGSAQLQETRIVDANVVAALLGTATGPMPLEFNAGRPFDQIEIEAESLVSLGYQLKVFYAYGIGVNQITTAKGYVSRFATPTAANYSTTATDNGVTVCVNSNVSNPTNAVDTDLTNYATMGALLDLSCPTSLQTQLEGTAPAGYYAGFVLGSRGLLDASVLGGLRLTTYLGTTLQETGTGAGLLSLSLLPSGQYNIRMATTKPYDRVEIRRVSLLGALDNLQVYYGFGVEPRVFRDQAPRLSRFASTAGNYQVNGSSLACVNCAISNPELAVDQDLTGNYATNNALLAAGGSTRLKMRLNGAGAGGNRAGVVLGLATGLVDAQLLTSLRVKTYAGTDGSELVETIADPSLIGLELLADGKQEVSFRTTRSFEWVELELTNGVSALNDARIYYAFADDAPSGFPSTITMPVSSPVTLTYLRATNSDGAIEVSWQTTAEANSSHFIVERSLSASGSFQALGRVNAAGNSNTTRQYLYRDFDGISQNAPTLYYRLRIVDLSGQESYSQVASVSVRPPVVIFEMYPNPASSSQQVRMQLPTDKAGTKYQVVVYDQMGQEISRETVSNARAYISASRLQPGLYQVTLINKSGQRLGTKRLVVQP
ncbi:T9SS type A sorting domain-containing protein [Hymenobacter metallilatus]|uniref:T9SS C-terminal target domain-containing protein n=1 Tax=Hymenobacter metallilatus TaxID=2493666 RepID=A0A428JT18_9BACT|nr:T9SS type A sorting domain-containing protein [Hymenobacter metallilatus]RSK37278.1 T9SS C-terminal target domain-containing protein [Hymenobacter metallilatus]